MVNNASKNALKFVRSLGYIEHSNNSLNLQSDIYKKREKTLFTTNNNTSINIKHGQHTAVMKMATLKAVKERKIE